MDWITSGATQKVYKGEKYIREISIFDRWRQKKACIDRSFAVNLIYRNDFH